MQIFMIYTILFLILLSATGMSSVFAQSTSVESGGLSYNSGYQNSSTMDPVTVATDKLSYNDGDKITISGSTRDNLAGAPVTIIIRNPVGNVIKVDQIDLVNGGVYVTTLTAGGGLMQAAGVYQVQVQYGDKSRSAQTSFVFTGLAGGNLIKVDGTDYTISYHITNGAILGIHADPTSKSLRVSIQSVGNGELTLVLPRGLIDSKVNDTDNKFLVSVNGVETSFQETSTTSTDRALVIPFTNGSSEIQIIGTFLIPEFGPITTAVFVLALISIIWLTARTKQPSWK